MEIIKAIPNEFNKLYEYFNPYKLYSIYNCRDIYLLNKINDKWAWCSLDCVNKHWGFHEDNLKKLLYGVYLPSPIYILNNQKDFIQYINNVWANGKYVLPT